MMSDIETTSVTEAHHPHQSLHHEENQAFLGQITMMQDVTVPVAE
jgi:hypothetical protein